jgi:hypothetical protein
MDFAPPRFAPRLLALAGVLALVSCGGGGVEPPHIYEPQSNLEVRMRDTPVEAADHVFVTIERVDVYRKVETGGEEDETGTKVVRETVTSVPGQYDLLSLQHGVEAVLGGGSFPPGLYKSIRLIVAKDTKDDIRNLPADQLKNYIVIDGVAHPLRVPSGAKTGIKLGKNFEIAEEGTTVLTIDFDVRNSVRKVGCKDVYLLKPRLKIVPNVEEQGDGAPLPLSGNVTTMDGSGLPSGLVVSVQQDGVEVAATMPDDTGAYAFTELADGTYDVVVIAPGYTFDAEMGVVVEDGTAGTHSFEIAPSDAGAVYGTATSSASSEVTVRLRWSGFVVATMDADPDDGTYLFDNVVVGDYDVEATDGSSDASQPVTVTPANATQVDFSL